MCERQEGHLSFDEVADPDFCHDRYRDSIDDGLDHGGVALGAAC